MVNAVGNVIQPEQGTIVERLRYSRGRLIAQRPIALNRKTAKTNGSRTMAEKTLDKLFHETLKDIYYAERKILKAATESRFREAPGRDGSACGALATGL